MAATRSNLIGDKIKVRYFFKHHTKFYHFISVMVRIREKRDSFKFNIYRFNRKQKSKIRNGLGSVSSIR